MMGLKDRTKAFSIQVFNLVEDLPETITARTIIPQLACSAASTAANYRAAQRSRSRAEFISKLSTVLEEIDESLFWLEVIADKKLLPGSRLEPMLKEADELCAIIYKSRHTARANADNYPTNKQARDPKIRTSRRSRR
jgi:four helix bundle protein